MPAERETAETVEDVVPEKVLLGDERHAVRALQHAAVALDPARTGEGDAGADEVLRFEGQVDVDLRPPVEHRLDEDQVRPAGG